MFYLLASIVILTAVFFALYKAKILSVCPICAGVVITWIIGLASLYANASWAEPNFVGILMAASVGAFAEKYGSKAGLLWKSLFVMAGLTAVYFLIVQNLVLGLTFGIPTAIIGYMLFSSKAKRGGEEDIFKNCC